MKSPDVLTAVRIYYEKIEIGSKEIAEIFGVSNTTAVSMKKAVKQKMAEKTVKCMIRGNVNTKIAFEVWGLDIVDLEKRAAKIKALLN